MWISSAAAPRRRTLAVLTMGATLIVSCTNATTPSAASSNASPSSSAPLAATSEPSKSVLSIEVADSQEPGAPSNVPLVQFKKQVESLSGGTIAIVVHLNASEDASPPGSDEPIVDKVKTGAFQMAVVPASAWSAVGVTTLRALQAPFLVRSDEHVAAIVNDEAITHKMLSGLSTVGVTGLALYPWSLRHFFSFTGPILTPADVKGRTVRTPGSVDIAAMLSALGAKAVLPDDAGFESGIADGTITAADSGFTVAQGSLPRAATATGNLVPYAKVITLVANTAFWNGLDDNQRDIISRASTATRAWAVLHLKPDVTAAAQYCRGGGKVVLTNAASIQAFRAKETAVDAGLEQDPGTKDLITAIGQLGTATASAPMTPCG
jgi:TRAP-type transport system periplasmic protein